MVLVKKISVLTSALILGVGLMLSMMSSAYAYDRGYFQPHAVPNVKERTAYPYAYPYPHPYPSLWKTPYLDKSCAAEFEQPMMRGYRVDFCYDKDRFCGRAAANAFCRSQGFRYATRFFIERDVGLTRNMRDGYVQRHLSRDGFRLVRCRT